MAISASMVKELREKTGAGMMDCKKALTNTDGDMDKAVEWLRENGLAKAEKKAGRIAAEGKRRIFMFSPMVATIEASSSFTVLEESPAHGSAKKASISAAEEAFT